MMMQKSETWVSASTHSTILVDAPGSPADWTLVGAVIAAAIPFVFANAVIAVHRHRIYFRAQGGVDLILGSSVSGLIWIAASIVQHEHIRRDTRILQVCALWSIWLQLALGFCLWVVCFIMRLHRLQILGSVEGEEQEKTSQLRAWTLFIPLLMTPALVYSAFATFKHGSLDSQSNQLPRELCRYTRTSLKRVGIIILMFFYMIILLIFIYKLKVKENHILTAEHRHTREAACITLLLGALFFILYSSNEQYRTAGRCFLTFSISSMVYSEFWIHMGQPVFMCLFRPKIEMENLEERYRARVLLALSSMRVRGVTSISIPACEDALLEALSTTIAELEGYKTMKEELEKEKLELVGRIDELHRKLGFSTIL